MKRTKYETETSVTYNLEEPDAMVWTCMPAMLRKFAKAGLEPYRIDGEGKAFKIPKSWILIRTKQTVRVLTDEQRKASGDRLRALRTS